MTPSKKQHPDSSTESKTIKRILIVDDDSMNLKILESNINKLGQNFEISKAFSGHQTLQLIEDTSPESVRYDFIIVDYYMPLMNGDELTKILTS